MKINGLNINKNFDAEPSLKTWAEAFCECCFKFNLNTLKTEDPDTYKQMLSALLDAYKTAKTYTGPIGKLKVLPDGQVVLPQGTLMHLTKPFADDEHIVIDYAKLQSVSTTGLISIGTLQQDAYEWDDEVPLQVSFHKCKTHQTVKDFIGQIKLYNKHLGITEIADLGLIFDTTNSGIEQLLAYDIAEIKDADIDYPNSYKTSKTNTPFAYKLKSYHPLISSVPQRQALGALLGASVPVANGKHFAYLPIAMPSQYIVGVVVPKALQDNQEYLNFLAKTFSKATLISSQGKAISAKSATLE